MSAKWSKGSSGPAGDEIANLVAQTGGVFDVAHSLRGEGFDASEDGTGRGTPLVPVAWSIMPQNSGKDYKARQVAVAQPLMAGGPVGGNQGGDYIQQPVPVAFVQNTRDEVRLMGGDGQSAGALGAETGAKQQCYVAEPLTIMERGRAGGQTLESRQDGTANAILTPNGGRGGMGVGAIALPWAVRRLTPTECERLQGFPDGFTQIPWRKKPADSCPDGPRYKALGNSWAVNCADWIGERIAEVEMWPASFPAVPVREGMTA